MERTVNPPICANKIRAAEQITFVTHNHRFVLYSPTSNKRLWSGTQHR
uniref:Uncharacterized protein n=1 Tax=Anguilla anguilla TaxID=7936 RepID=A0A0E9W5K0_ANGAN